MAGLVFAMLRQRWLTSALHAAILALGVAAATALLIVSAQTDARLRRDAQGIDLVVGAKGSPLQLVLSSVFHADVPAGNVPFALAGELAADRRVLEAIPIGLGDSAGGFRVVGAPGAFAALYAAAPAQGRLPAAPLEAVLGAEAARALGLRVGATLVSSHGLGDGGGAHEEEAYTVVGVLAPTGAVIDRLIVTPLESVWAVHGQHQPTDEHGEDHDHHEDAVAPAREATAILLKLRSPIAGPTLRREINQRTPYLAARPADEAARLFALIGGGLEAFRALALVLIAVAALSVFASLFAMLSERRGDLALLRTMGATRAGVFGLMIGQGLAVAAVGTGAGLLLGHMLVEVAAAAAPQAQGFGLTGAVLHPGEAWIALGGLGAGLLAALIPAALAYRADIADVLAQSP